MYGNAMDALEGKTSKREDVVGDEYTGSIVADARAF